MLKTKKSFSLLILLMATAIVLLVVIWRMQTSPRTDDAYVYADTIAISPEVNGRIIAQPVKDNQRVHKGDLLFRIDPRPYEAALQQAQAKLDGLNQQIELTQRSVNAQKFSADSAQASIASASAAAKQATATLRRLEPLLAQGFASAEEVDQARTAKLSAISKLDTLKLQAKQAKAGVSGVEALVAQRAEASALIQLAKLNLEFTEVRAPFDGRIASLKTAVGQFASAGKPIFTLIDTSHWYVIANFRETELKEIKEGTPAQVYLMSNTGIKFSGHVDSISYGITPDDGATLGSGLPNVKRTINWVHVSQRFPVKIRIANPDENLFRVGASAVATLKTRP
ncbi:multidrug transporter subunit MdtN [Enterobacteriaceae bacterium H11S18]|uniref:multidrug transporter subunit MdtN n=1 Tax=Dryocola clanedunensis TaxID=2925396 RepID=UPI0022EFE8B6|nr:multidrug transporter subunit MdtN [Dryocola clanedunensis]MCT4713377.1 multidrug transporter subunit MdtN [Dryocola clanedunensis]